MIEELSIDDIFYRIDELSKDNKVIIITDSNVNYLYLKDKSYNIIVFEPGEDNKNLDTIQYIYSRLQELNADRNTILIGFGGGIVTDITGYVASTYMRGLKFIYVSTTLLGMVDASIGGKNGVNFKDYKNIIGTFNLPEHIYYSINFLNTLPNKELHAGFGEILKYAIGFDYTLFNILFNSSYEEIIKDDYKLKQIIDKCIHIKELVITEDFKENKLRKKLNLGHTIAHAIEKYTHNIVHGEAVGIGLYVIAFYSSLENNVDFKELIEILKLLEKYDLAYFAKYDYKEILRNCIDYISMDKKKEENSIDIITINGIGKSEIKTVDIDKFKKSIKQLFLY